MVYISSACIKKEKISDVLHLYAENGLTNIELSGGTDYYDGLERDLIELKKKYKLNYVCHAYFPPPKEHFVINLASCNDILYQKSIDYYISNLDFLTINQIRNLSIHAGFLFELTVDEIGKTVHNPRVYNAEESVERFCYAYKKIEKECNRKGIRLYLENNVISRNNYIQFDENNYFMMTDAKSIGEIRNIIDFNLLVDLGHLNVSANTLGLDFEEQCACLADYAKWIHLSDNDGISDQHLPLNDEGKIATAYRKYFSQIECTLETCGSMDEIIHSLKIVRG